MQLAHGWRGSHLTLCIMRPACMQPEPRWCPSPTSSSMSRAMVPLSPRAVPPAASSTTAAMAPRGARAAPLALSTRPANGSGWPSMRRSSSNSSRPRRQPGSSSSKGNSSRCWCSSTASQLAAWTYGCRRSCPQLPAATLALLPLSHPPPSRRSPPLRVRRPRRRGQQVRLSRAAARLRSSGQQPHCSPAAAAPRLRNTKPTAARRPQRRSPANRRSRLSRLPQRQQPHERQRQQQLQQHRCQRLRAPLPLRQPPQARSQRLLPPQQPLLQRLQPPHQPPPSPLPARLPRRPQLHRHPCSASPLTPSASACYWTMLCASRQCRYPHGLHPSPVQVMLAGLLRAHLVALRGCQLAGIVLLLARICCPVPVPFTVLVCVPPPFLP